MLYHAHMIISWSYIDALQLLQPILSIEVNAESELSRIDVIIGLIT